MVHGAEEEHKAYQEEFGKQDTAIRGGPECPDSAHLDPGVGKAGEEHYSQSKTRERGKAPGAGGQQ